MTETKLISIRVPADLLELIDKEADSANCISRSSLINNILQGVFDSADSYTRFLLKTWRNRERRHYKMTVVFDPNVTVDNNLQSKNLVTF